MNHHGIHGDDQGVNWVPLFTLELHCSSILKGRRAFTPCLPPAVSLTHWEANRKMLQYHVTMNVINGCSVFCDRLLQELPTWEIVYLQLSERLFLGAFSHTHKIQTNQPTYFYLLDGCFSALKLVATTFTHL